jgi:carbon-monoxide dehydrogenase small subunit
VEGLAPDQDHLHPLQESMRDCHGLQCGYCTPGMIAAAQDLLKRAKDNKSVPSRDEIREHLSGNYCRCTGYQAIVDAVEAVAQTRAKGRSP